MVTNDDTKIFSKDGGVRNWVHLTTDVHDMEDITLEVDSGDSGVGMGAKPSEAVVGGELMKGMQGGQGDERPRLQPRGMSSPQNYRS